MRLKLFFTYLILSVVICGYAANENDILISASKKLQSLKTVKYQTSYKSIDPMGVAVRSDSATVFYDFESNDKIIGTKYLFRNKAVVEGFNGTKSFFTVEEKKQLVYFPTEDVNQLVGVFKDAFPIHTLRNLLPKILDDKSIQISNLRDTIINLEDCYRFKIIMNGKSIFMNRELMANENIYMTYVLTIGKKDLLPKQFINYFEDKSPIWIVDYSDYNLSYVPNDFLFDCDLGYKDYDKFTMEEYSNVLRKEISQKGNSLVGTTVDDWVLPSLRGDSVRLSQINAKVILLEFWFPGCTGCVKAVPEINQLSKTFENKDLHIYGVEFTRTDSIGLVKYVEELNIEYPTLYTGNTIAEEYGIMAAPTIVMLDNKRKVLYSNTGFRKNEIVEVIERTIKFSP
ncbi:TlpA family protein disulfide reductase [Maribellus sediminis]|uniref:TlpA family protein disulfide reductase n=1 Tax=Maribellus sediminis TaxID=2696285 RepID=UPI00142FD744|nr:TlpA disulfide reductase family protein [Maribellus sediminis]